METIAQFLARGDVFMARGQRHIIDYAQRDGEVRQVIVLGHRANGEYFEATFAWGETIETIDRVTL